jgi:hypothetical protein
MGAFPIQTSTSCADEWISNGSSGILVRSIEPEEVAKAISTALQDDALVDSASEANRQEIESKANPKKLNQSAKSFYGIS